MDAMKPYSALDRTTSALPNNMNYQQHMTGRNNLPENSISRVPTQTMTSSSSMSNPNQQSYPAQRSNLPNSNYPNSSNPSVNPQAQSTQQRYPTSAQPNTQNMGYQQQRQTSMPAMGMPQHQQPPHMQQQQNPNSNNLQSQNGRAYPNQSITNVGMGPNQIQQMSNPSYDGKNDAISRQQARVDSYPNNIPMMALQQQKVLLLIF